jgi:hypothetical protein
MNLLGEVETAAATYHDAMAAADRAREALYAAIREAYAQGIPAARIGRHAGLSRERVRQVVERRYDPGDPGATTR